MNTIAKKISRIIDKRRKQSENVAHVIEEWKRLKAKIRKIDERKDELKSGYKDNSRLDLRFEKIDFSNVIKKIEQELDELENLKKRLSRSTLNIGVIGGMRQGKSRLLQTLTGLGDDEIPTGNEGVCTRVLSKIFHSGNSQKSETIVKYHSSESLKEIIYLYFDKLGLPGSKPNIPNDLESRNYPPKLPLEKKNDTDAKYQYGFLRRNYYGNYKKYEQLINRSPEVINKKNIKKYITQTDSNESEYIAVKELEISCEFPYREVGDIGVIDLPGLGDTIIDTELLIKTLKQDIDFILFVRKPNPDGDDWKDSDRNMYQIACDALEGFPVSQCSFMILNKKGNEKESNLRVCEYLEKKLSSHEIDVSKIVIADCSNSHEVESLILEPILENLTNNINFVSEQYLDSQNKILEKLWEEISKKLDESNKVLEGYSEQTKLGFHDWYEEKFWKPLNGKMIQERQILYSKMNQPRNEFEKEIGEVVESCRNDNNTDNLSKKIEGFRNSHDSYKIAYYMCINELKDELIRKFKLLANALKKSESDLQSLIIDILYEQGKFKELTNQNKTELFDEIESQLPVNTNKLREALQEIKKSTLTYEDEVIRWIQSPLNELNPDKHLDPISERLMSDQNSKFQKSVDSPKLDDVVEHDNVTPNNTNNVDINSENHVFSTNLHEEEKEDSELKNIQNKIHQLRNKIVEDCKKELDKKLPFPNEEAFTKFDKFFVLAFKGELGQREWRYFCEQPKIKSLLWEGAKKNEENQKVEEDWNDLVNDAIIITNKKDALLLQKN